jgi:molecular chaperone HtpG
LVVCRDEHGGKCLSRGLHGVVDLLSSAIYSSPRVYLRELIQNAADAITARAQLESGFVTAGIRITPFGVGGVDALRMVDDGVGLTPDDGVPLFPSRDSE